MRIQDYKPEEAKIRFSLALVRLLNTYNYLDLNLGLSIRFLENPSNPEASDKKLANMTTEQKLVLWQSLLVKGEWVTTPEQLSELEDWAKRANTSRHTRNRYVHGRWQILPLRQEKPVGLAVPPWWKDKTDAEVTDYMSLDELESVADEMEDMFKEFNQLRNKHNI